MYSPPTIGIKFLKLKLADLTSTAIKALPENILHSLLYFLRTNDGFAKQVQTIVKATSNLTSSTLIPLLYDGDASVGDSKE